jgi:L-ascorbate metabolism protein UlaG (beta-lactamase superfamily)
LIGCAILNKNNNNIESNQAEIYYLGHSGWAVKTKSHFLIFDYLEANKNVENKALTNGHINPVEIKNENVFVFVSHKHQDHFDKIIKGWKNIIPNITYIAGWMSIGSNFIGVPPHTNTTIDDITISTLKSTDDGSGFLINVDGLSIFYAGDHANWEDNDPEVSYFDEIDYIADISSMVDIAFIPVTTFSGLRPNCMTEGAIYAIKKLKPNVTFPMHGNNREYLYKEFANEEGARDYNIVCAEKPGNRFLYKQDNMTI